MIGQEKKLVGRIKVGMFLLFFFVRDLFLDNNSKLEFHRKLKLQFIS